MAQTGYTDSRGNGGRMVRTASRGYVYVQGSEARELAHAPQETGRKEVKGSRTNGAAREHVAQMKFSYVLFLAVVTVLTMWVCVNFLQLRVQATVLQKEVAALEAELDSAILENDSEYNRVMNTIDLEHIKDVAMNELGMRKATTSQIVTFELENGDYVRQYAEIPAE